MNAIINEILNANVPTRLLVGTQEQIQDLTELAIRSKFCKQNNTPESVLNCACIDCRRIKNRQHPSIVWISPEKNYSVDDVEIIFDRTQFALDSGQTFFFVLDKASSLNPATANKMLKVLEEPPVGYKFILLAENINSLPVTIASRSHIIKVSSNNEPETAHPFLKFFASPENRPEPTAFDQELKKASITEQECVEICYDLMELFVKKITETNSEYHKNGLNIIRKRLRKPPCPGSSSLFLKLLYLDFCQL